eukprot:211356-Pleurochrysis_carterae.AAC.3
MARLLWFCLALAAAAAQDYPSSTPPSTPETPSGDEEVGPDGKTRKARTGIHSLSHVAFQAETGIERHAQFALRLRYGSKKCCLTIFTSPYSQVLRLRRVTRLAQNLLVQST